MVELPSDSQPAASVAFDAYCWARARLAFSWSRSAAPAGLSDGWLMVSPVDSCCSSVACCASVGVEPRDHLVGHDRRGVGDGVGPHDVGHESLLDFGRRRHDAWISACIMVSTVLINFADA